MLQESETPISFGLWLKKCRVGLELTQADLADCVGCSVVTIRKIEADERRPSEQIAELLAKCLHLPAGQHALFLQVARSERRVERLAAVSPAPPAGADRPAAPIKPTRTGHTFTGTRPRTGRYRPTAA